MELSMSKAELRDYVTSQLKHFFPDKHQTGFVTENQVVFNLALERTEYCFAPIILKQYKKKGETYLNHLYSDQYAVFLWFLSNSVWKETNDAGLANKLFYLNKSLHGFSCTFDTKLPDIFMLMHTVGTVLGKANYSNYLVASQGSTVGAQNGKYPILGKAVALLPYASIIGDCKIGERVSIGIHSTVYKKDVPSDSIVIKDENGVTQYKTTNTCWASSIFDPAKL